MARTPTRAACQMADRDSVGLRLLRSGLKRRKKADSESNREPDPPRGTSGRDDWRLPSTLNVSSAMLPSLYWRNRGVDKRLGCAKSCRRW
jgi:hypothetical protein